MATTQARRARAAVQFTMTVDALETLMEDGLIRLRGGASILRVFGQHDAEHGCSFDLLARDVDHEGDAMNAVRGFLRRGTAGKKKVA